jgi:hypothetical protein
MNWSNQRFFRPVNPLLALLKSRQRQLSQLKYPKETTLPRKRGNTESGSSSSQSPTPPLFHFNPGTKADQKYTLAFTEEELEIIEDIKLDLRRRFGIKTSKN